MNQSPKVKREAVYIINKNDRSSPVWVCEPQYLSSVFDLNVDSIRNNQDPKAAIPATIAMFQTQSMFPVQKWANVCQEI